MRKIILITLVYSFSVSGYSANISQSDKLFGEPRENTVGQILAGLGDALAAAVSAGLFIANEEDGSDYDRRSHEKKVLLNEAQQDYKKVSDIRAVEDIDAYKFELNLEKEKLEKELELEKNVGSTKDKLQDKLKNVNAILNDIQNGKIVSMKSKALLLEVAQKNLESATRTLISEYPTHPISASKSAFRAIYAGGTIFFVSDIVGRVYVWHGLDAEPGFSPAATAIRNVFFGQE